MCNENSRPCAVCGEEKAESFKIYFDGYMKLYRCLSCGFVAHFPGPGRTYAVDYEESYSLDFLTNKREFKYPERRLALQSIAESVKKHGNHGNLLDVGCGDGHFLFLCAKMGFDCYGVEPSKPLADHAGNKTGAKITQGFYTRSLFPENFFDVITFIQVLEHIHTPIQILEVARYHLKPGGILVIEVPSIHSPHFLAYQFTGIKRFVGPPYGIIHSHFGYFSPKSLLRLTASLGFDQIELITGRWKDKYKGLIRLIALVIDPLLNFAQIGGILFIGKKPPAISMPK